MRKRSPDPTTGSCSLPFTDDEKVSLAHGGGGRMTQRLIEQLFLPALGNEELCRLHDGAELELSGARLAFSTDSFVVDPLFFPGGDIGSLAVHGTINDLAMCGARPVALSAGWILEEGLPMERLRRLTESMGRAASQAGVPIVTGDTKVVDRGKGDGVFVNTTGVGLIAGGVRIGPARARPGDRILINGSLADHGIAILSVREGLEFDTTLESDSAALHGLVAAMLEAGGDGVRVLRDPTRGGVASAMNEIAGAAGVEVRLDESAFPVSDAVRGACEILGLDPFYVANEGKLLAIVDEERAEPVLRAMRGHPLGVESAVVGEVADGAAGRVVLEGSIGGSRILGMLSGEQLPRIC